jgi:O-acetyl-ADP-ribose deacetylase (regulator of RNase III)
MKIVKGNLISLAQAGEFDVIVHGCNCFCTMGAGIAKQIKEKFPEAYMVDQKTDKGNKDKLGSISYVSINRDEITLTIVNGYTQYNWRGSGVLVDYEAVRSVFKQIKSKFPGNRIGYPKIGSGLAKGDWEIISKIIDEELDGEDHKLVEYST